MRNLKLLAILVVGAFAFQSCNNDDEGSSANKADLVGVWTSSEIDISFIADGESIQDEDAENILRESESSTIEFKEDNTYVSDEGTDFEENGTWSLNGDGSKIIFEPENSLEYEVEVLAASANQIKLKFEEDITQLAAFIGIEVDNELIIVIEVNMNK